MYNKTNLYLLFLLIILLFLCGCSPNNTLQSNASNIDNNNTINTTNKITNTSAKQPENNKILDEKLQSLIELAKTYKGKQGNLLSENKIDLGGTNGYIVVFTPYFEVTLDALKNIQNYQDYNLENAKNKYYETKDIFAICCFLYSNEPDFIKNPTTVIKIGNKIIHPTDSSGQQFSNTSEYFPDPAYIGGCISYFNISDLGDVKNFQFAIVINGKETNFDIDLSKIKFNEF